MHVKSEQLKEFVKEFMRVGRNGLDQTRTTSGITVMLLFCTPLNNAGIHPAGAFRAHACKFGLW